MKFAVTHASLQFVVTALTLTQAVSLACDELQMESAYSEPLGEAVRVYGYDSEDFSPDVFIIRQI